MNNPFFNAHHAPIGAFATFTLGQRGASGGLALELGKPADQDVYIGLETADGGAFEALPFFQSSDDGEQERLRYEQEQANQALPPWGNAPISYFPDDGIHREFKVATDRWACGDLTFAIYSPVRSVPDPESGVNPAELMAALAPVVLAEITVDNSHGRAARRAFFGYAGNDPYGAMRHMGDTMPGYIGIGQGVNTAIVTDDAGTRSGQGFSLATLLAERRAENLMFGLGGSGAVLMDTPAGEIRTFRFAICFHRSGIVTAGLATHYYYTRFFPTIESVARYALAHFDDLKEAALDADAWLDAAPLSTDQRFMLAHAIRSYYGSTQMLDHGGAPLWVVNEGEYRMMNTLDLTVNQMFYEMKIHPWTVRKELDLFAARYSYRDTLQVRGEAGEIPGGIGFTHDMGVANVFSRPGHSSYEQGGLHGCFSQMTCEQVVNWLCCAGVYGAGTGDAAWLRAKRPILEACFESLLRRDHPEPEQRTGVMKFDSSRTAGGSEITTYDSLDSSLGQARGNIYLAGKSWAGMVLLEKIFVAQGASDLAREAGAQADRCARTLTRHMTAEGFIPAVLDEGSVSHIIPAIEGLVYPYFGGCRDALDPKGRFGAYLAALHRHFETVLTPGVCLFEGGAWKLSSTSNNSWLSKIYLCQFVARKILGVRGPAVKEAADSAHVSWLLDPENTYWAWSDQMVSGKAAGSRYYPRGVTAILWLEEAGR